MEAKDTKPKTVCCLNEKEGMTYYSYEIEKECGDDDGEKVVKNEEIKREVDCKGYSEDHLDQIIAVNEKKGEVAQKTIDAQIQKVKDMKFVCCQFATGYVRVGWVLEAECGDDEGEKNIDEEVKKAAGLSESGTLKNPNCVDYAIKNQKLIKKESEKEAQKLAEKKTEKKEGKVDQKEFVCCKCESCYRKVTWGTKADCGDDEGEVSLSEKDPNIVKELDCRFIYNTHFKSKKDSSNAKNICCLDKDDNAKPSDKNISKLYKFYFTLPAECKENEGDKNLGEMKESMCKIKALQYSLLDDTNKEKLLKEEYNIKAKLRMLRKMLRRFMKR